MLGHPMNAMTVVPHVTLEGHTTSHGATRPVSVWFTLRLENLLGAGRSVTQMETTDGSPRAALVVLHCGGRSPRY